MGMLLREALILGVVGTIAGILLTYGSRSLIHVFAPTWTATIVKSWWWKAGLIALGAALFVERFIRLKSGQAGRDRGARL